jgi:RHS repeat-associated protein
MNLNPFRYRGYYYDRETGFYYLQSRYYDPETGRFLNADGLISTGTGVAGYNMYAYCNNNPVNYIDPSGACSECARIFMETTPRPMFYLVRFPWPYPGGTRLYYNYEAFKAADAVWNAQYRNQWNKTHFIVNEDAIPPVDISKVDAGLIDAINRMAGEANVTVTITSGYRSIEEQQALWDQSTNGVLPDGNPVAYPGSSWHNYGGAVDISKIAWDLNFSDYGLNVRVENTCYHITWLRNKHINPLTDGKSFQNSIIEWGGK